jgi:Ca-activated chloride channel family protein
MKIGLGPWLLLFSMCVSVLLPRRAAAEDVDAADNTLAPYFAVQGPDSEALPLRSSKVSVAVASGIADVTVTQTYENRGKRAINARYVFPASTRAAVRALEMKLRDRVIRAKIERKERAKSEFEHAKKSGKSAALLEAERPNVFSMSVANLVPGDRIEVSLSYSELLAANDGVYEFVFPAVVGPRYSSAGQSNSKRSQTSFKTAYLPEGEASGSDFHLEGTLSSAIPFQKLWSDTHALSLVRDNSSFVRFALDAKQAFSGNRDFVLRYTLAAGALQSGLSLYAGASEKFFLLQVEPPEHVTAEDMPPREFVFVVDISGSMHGFPLDTAKVLLRNLVRELRPVDSFNLLLFSGGSRLLSPRSLPASESNLRRALSVIDQEQAGGGTELLPALQRALDLPSEPGRSRTFVVVTDGYIAADREALELVRNNLGKANVFAFGIGSSVNRFLIEGIARAGLGEPFVVTQATQAPAAIKRFYEYVRAPVLTNVRVEYEGFEVHDLEPRAIPDVLARRPVVIFGKWRGEPKGTITVSGVGGEGRYEQRFDVSRVTPRPENRALVPLWARTRVANVADFGFGELTATAREQVTALGLKYGVLTDYTSFVAISEKVRNDSGRADDVAQPLPLPVGVSANAVGTNLESAPEPESLLLLAALVALLLARNAWSRLRARAPIARESSAT